MKILKIYHRKLSTKTLEGFWEAMLMNLKNLVCGKIY